MSKLLQKLKMKTSIKKQIENDKSGGAQKDLRVLNYWDMKDQDKITVLLMPFTDGALYHRVRRHGPSLRDNSGKSIRGIGSIGCARDKGQDCPACQVAYGFLDLEKETGDKSHRDTAKKWFPQETTLAQCIVLDTPIEIHQAEDKNEVKLFSVPYKVMAMIENQILEGLIEEEELYLTPLILKKDHPKSARFASYENSYFARKLISEEQLEAFDDLVIEPFGYDDLVGNAIPEAPTTAEVQEWTDKAEELFAKAIGVFEEEDEKPSAVRGESSRTPSRTCVVEEVKESPEYDEDVSEEWEVSGRDEPEQEVEAKTKSEAPVGESVKDRLARIRNRR